MVTPTSLILALKSPLFPHFQKPPCGISPLEWNDAEGRKPNKHRYLAGIPQLLIFSNNFVYLSAFIPRLSQGNFPPNQLKMVCAPRYAENAREAYLLPERGGY
jgi:hypothetical protein